MGGRGRRHRSSADTLRAALLIGGGAAAVLFLAAPQIALIFRAVQARGWEALPTSGVAEALSLSVVTTALSSLLTVALGTPLAYLLACWRFPGRRLLIVLVELPIVLPPTVAGLALLVTVGRRGLLGPMLGGLGVSLPFTTAAVVIAQTFVAAPFFIRAAQSGFGTIPRETLDAARVDGAAGPTLFRLIMLPLAGPALAAGLTLSWARALGEFGATILFAGSIAGRTQTMTLFIYNVLESNIDAAIFASVILLALAAAALLLAQWLTRRSDITY